MKSVNENFSINPLIDTQQVGMKVTVNLIVNANSELSIWQSSIRFVDSFAWSVALCHRSFDTRIEILDDP